MPQIKIILDDESELPSVLSEFYEECNRCALTTAERARLRDEVSGVVRSLITRGHELSSMNCVFRTTKTICSDGCEAVVEARFGGAKPSVAKRMLQMVCKKIKG